MKGMGVSFKLPASSFELSAVTTSRDETGSNTTFPKNRNRVIYI